MKIFKRKNRIIASFLAVALALLLGAGFPAVEAKAASGNVYTCVINPCYAHPVTGVIEDSGGESSYATGQGMVEGCVYSTGILEVTDSGEYYLTIRMSLMDYTSGHSFWVQNVGDSSWSSPAIGQTGSGTDTNGTTADICIQVPSENCVVRGSMYVEPMGRDVIFYLYPSDYSAGNTTDMSATMVTTASGTDNSTSNSGSTSTESSSSTTSGTSSVQAGSSNLTSGNTALTAGESSDTESTDSTAEGTDTTTESTDTTTPTLSSSITEAADPTSDDDADGEDTVSSAEGLSLSTEDAAASGDTATAESVTKTTSTKTIITWVAAVTVGILIVVAVVAIIVYFFRKNWSRWGGGEDDYEYEDE